MTGPANSGAKTATLITNTVVRPGSEGQYLAWQKEMHDLISSFPGFIGGDIIPPYPPVQTDWVAVQRFQTTELLRNWLDSPQRANKLQEMKSLTVDDDTVNVFVGRDPMEAESSGPVTAVVQLRVRPGVEKEFLKWQAEIEAAQSAFPGYQGVEVQPPVAGLQEDYVILLRFDSAQNLDGWLASAERQRLVEASPLIESSSVHKTRAAFDGWFHRPDNSPPPPGWKMSMIVLAVLFPVVSVSILLLDPILSTFPRAIWVFSENVVSVTLMGLWLVPFVSSRLSWWLSPEAAEEPAATRRGVTYLCLYYGIAIVVFWYLFTHVHIPTIHFFPKITLVPD